MNLHIVSRDELVTWIECEDITCLNFFLLTIDDDFYVPKQLKIINVISLLHPERGNFQYFIVF